MSDGCKRILSFFTGHRKRKAWNKTREKYKPVKRRQNLAGTDRRSCYNKEEWLEEFLDGKSAFYNDSMVVILMIRIIMKIMISSSYRRVFPIVATKYSSQFC